VALSKPRTHEQVLTDRLLILEGIRLSEKYGWLKSTKLQKLFFYGEYLMNEAGDRALNLLFRRLNFGPYSDELEKDVTALESVSYLTVENGDIQVDDLGDRVLRDARDLLKNNEWVSAKLSSSARKIAPMTTIEALEFVYSLPIKSRYGSVVEDIPDGATIVKPLGEDVAQRKLTLDKEDLETLDILLDPDTIRGIYDLLDKRQRSPLMPFVVD